MTTPLPLAVIPTHQVATWLLNTIDGLLNHVGLQNHQIVEEVIYVIVISLISVAIGIILKKLVLYITHRVIVSRQNPTAIELHNRRVFEKCSHIIPPLVFMALIPFAFNEHSDLLGWIYKIVGIYTLLAFATGVNAILKFIFDRFTANNNRKNLPLRGVLNIAIGAVWIVISILCVCILLDKSPATLLAGLGAFAAALMLIFKDSILGFVAGIQMSDNDMLRVGDWIVVPDTPANGIVQDVSLSTVKVLNWNLSTVMVPPYTLVSTSFQNYRSMYGFNRRLIENSVIIDMTTVRPADQSLVDSISDKFPEMKGFLDEISKNNEKAVNDTGLRPVNGTVETNLGLYRAYVGSYLNAHPKIAKDQQILVRLMQGTDSGMALQLWCFTASSDWAEYEGVQSEVFENIMAVAPLFGGLRVYSSANVTVENRPDMQPLAPQPSK